MSKILDKIKNRYTSPAKEKKVAEDYKLRMKRVFLKEPVWKLGLKFVPVLIVGVGFIGLFNFLSSLLINQLVGGNFNYDHILYSGADPVKATTIAVGLMSPQLTLITAVATMNGLGLSVFYSLATGKNDTKLLDKTMFAWVINSALLIIITALILQYAGDAWFKFELGSQGSSTSDATQRLALFVAHKQMRWFIYAIPLFIFQWNLVSLFRNGGRIELNFLVSTLPIVVLILMEFTFLKWHNTGNKYSLDGAGISAFITYGVQLTAALSFWIFMPDLTLRFEAFTKWNYDLPHQFKLVWSGFSSFARNFSVALIGTVIYGLISHLPTTDGTHDQYILYFSAIMPVITLLFLPMFGALQSMQAPCSYNYAAHETNRVKKSMYAIVIGSLTYAVLIYIITALAIPKEILSSFVGSGDKANPVNLNYAVKMFRIIMASAIPFSFAFFGYSYFQFTYQPLKSFAIVTMRGYWIFIPMVYLFSFIATKTGNPDWFWATYLVVAVITATISSVATWISWRKIELLYKKKQVEHYYIKVILSYLMPKKYSKPDLSKIKVHSEIS